jgi:uncharacterized protein
MILIADSSALVALAACDSLVLLDEIFGQVIVPEAVYREVVHADKFQSNRLKDYLHDKVRQVDMQGFVYLDAFADVGETEAMLLYKEIAADYLLIDDKRGRKIASLNYIKTIGSLGVLLQAKRMGLVHHIGPLIRKITESPVFISESLVTTVLELAGELIRKP